MLAAAALSRTDAALTAIENWNAAQGGDVPVPALLLERCLVAMRMAAGSVGGDVPPSGAELHELVLLSQEPWLQTAEWAEADAVHRQRRSRATAAFALETQDVVVCEASVATTSRACA